MFDKLITTFQRSGTIAIALLIANAVQANSQEYVYSAPPEVDYELTEIPNSDTEYPLYECNQESEQQNQESIDSHGCDCVDCENVGQNSDENEQLTSKNNSNKH